MKRIFALMLAGLLMLSLCACTNSSNGTGTILAMGIIPGTMTYSVENGVFNLTVSMLGQTESGTGYIKCAGDKLYIMNVKKEIEILTKQG